MKIKILTDSETLLHGTIRNASTTERRLIKFINAKSEAYNEGTINHVIRIRRGYSLADSVTNLKY